jgi:hypothetical protein
MRRVVGGSNPPSVDMGIDLGRRDVLVAEKFLNRAQVRAMLKEMGGKGVPKHVGMGGIQADHLRPPFQNLPKSLSTKTSSSSVDK